MNIEHIAIILDGNRRWAKEKGLATHLGHKAGADNLDNFVREADKLKLKYLTVYLFSTENWKRSEIEINFLMKLFRVYFKKILNDKEINYKIKFFSSHTNLDKKLIDMINKLEEFTKDNTGIQLNLCFNYGGRLEITEAVLKIIDDIDSNKISKTDISESLISDYLYSKNIPDPEIIIRTSGEMRLSNFLLWQNVYSELFFVKKYWPDFKIEDLNKVIEEFNKRNRTFGGK